MSQATRVHLGASSLELLARSDTAEFIHPSWMHLGDPPNYEARSDTGTLKSRARAWAKRLLRRGGVAAEGDPALYARTNFRPWMFTKGDRLPFEDSSIGFIYSEHVFEHFRYDILTDLLAESLRVLKPGGVIRTVVPDADYRTYEKPEMSGYPNPSMAFSHPNKHKIRWNNYLLAQTLKFVGLEPKSLVWCDEDGRFIAENPAEAYRGRKVADAEMVYTLRYVQRKKSLIVDGLKVT